MILFFPLIVSLWLFDFAYYMRAHNNCTANIRILEMRANSIFNCYIFIISFRYNGTSDEKLPNIFLLLLSFKWSETKDLYWSHNGWAKREDDSVARVFLYVYVQRPATMNEQLHNRQMLENANELENKLHSRPKTQNSEQAKQSVINSLNYIQIIRTDSR